MAGKLMSHEALVEFCPRRLLGDLFLRRLEALLAELLMNAQPIGCTAGATRSRLSASAFCRNEIARQFPVSFAVWRVVLDHPIGEILNFLRLQLRLSALRNLYLVVTSPINAVRDFL